MEPWLIALAGGLLPFGSIFIEMYFVFTSFWAYKIYFVYGFMLLVLVILAIVTVCVTIVCCYLLLNSEVRWGVPATCFSRGAGLPVALDVVLQRRVDQCLRVCVLGVLLLLQDQDVRHLPDHVLLWLLRSLCARARRHVRSVVR